MKSLLIISILTITNAYSQCDANGDGDLDILDVIENVNCILTDCWELDTTAVCVNIDGNSYETVQIGAQL